MKKLLVLVALSLLLLQVILQPLFQQIQLLSGSAITITTANTELISQQMVND